jgi:branched-chain amino acid transport system substrate-binding protein
MFQRRTLARFIAGATIAAALPLGAYAQGKEPVKVGLVTSKTGVWAEMGEEVARGIKFAIEEANAAGGVDGRRIEVAEGDDEGTPEAGRRAAEKLARDGYNLLIGSIGSAVSLAIAQGLDRWDAAYFTTISKSDKITGDSCKARNIRTVQSDAIDMAMISQWAPNLQGEKFAIIASDYAWGHDSANSFKKAVEAKGKKVLLSLFVPLGTKDYSPYISQLKAANVDMIWAAIPARDGISFMKQAGEFGLMPKTPVLGHAMLSDFMVRATGDYQEGMVGTLGYGVDLDIPRNKAFVAAWQAKFNRPPTETEGLGYLGASVMLEGVRLAKSVKPAEVTAALRGAQIDTVLGKLTVRAADNQLLVPNFIARVKNVDGQRRPVVEQVFDPSIAPAPSPLCKL